MDILIRLETFFFKGKMSKDNRLKTYVLRLFQNILPISKFLNTNVDGNLMGKFLCLSLPQCQKKYCATICHDLDIILSYWAAVHI